MNTIHTSTLSNDGVADFAAFNEMITHDSSPKNCFRLFLDEQFPHIPDNQSNKALKDVSDSLSFEIRDFFDYKTKSLAELSPSEDKNVSICSCHDPALGKYTDQSISDARKTMQGLVTKITKV